MAGPAGSNSTLVLTLGIFLKLLGFFVVLVSYSTLEPLKSRQAQYSLQDRFGINLGLPLERGGLSKQSPMVVQQQGRSYDILRKELMTQMDFLSTENVATSDRLSLSLPMDIVLGLNGAPAKSPELADRLSAILKTQKPDHMQYQVTIIGQNGDPVAVLHALGEFVQKMVATDYPSKFLTIGYTTVRGKTPQVLIEVRAVAS